MRQTIRKIAADLRVRIGYLVAFGLLVVSYLVTLYANRNLLKETQMVNHTHRVMIDTEKLLSSLKDAESAFRGFIVVKDSSFLPPYHRSRMETDSFFSLLKTETSDNPSQQQRLNTLTQLIHKKYGIFDNAVFYFSNRSFIMSDSLKTQAYIGYTLMIRIAMVGKEIESEEERLLQIRKDKLNTQYGTMNKIVMASLLLAFLLVIYGFITYSKENRARREADIKVDLYQDQLKERIIELGNANNELIQMRSMEKFSATGRIARTIAHEVRNPLTNINLATDMLKNDLDGNGEAYKMLEMIHRNSNRINQLISDLLNSTKVTELNAEKVSINSLLDETLELAKDRLELFGVLLKKNFASDDRKVFVDKEKMKIAFLNIIVNAIESMEAGSGILEVSTESAKDQCVIKISDNGKGIDKESLSKLFEPFFTKKPGGTGLGLTNTQNIIFTHNGQIIVESTPGLGTTFIVLLNYM